MTIRTFVPESETDKLSKSCIFRGGWGKVAVAFITFVPESKTDISKSYNFREATGGGGGERAFPNFVPESKTDKNLSSPIF